MILLKDSSYRFLPLPLSLPFRIWAIMLVNQTSIFIRFYLINMEELKTIFNGLKTTERLQIA